MMSCDASKAFFEDPIQRGLCIELPADDMREGDKKRDMVGHSKQSLCGTRNVAANFQAEVQKLRQSIGFGLADSPHVRTTKGKGS